MTELFLVLLRILFPLDPVARLREVTRDYLSEIMGWLDDPLDVAEIAQRPDWLEILEAHIIVAENGVELLITERARQLAGLPFIYTRRMAPPHLRKVKSLPRLLNRLTRLAGLFHNLEHLAQRRAERMQRETSDPPYGGPLRLAATLQSTSPALRAVEDTAHVLEVLPRRRRGRWIGATSRRDGGGCALARGPPPSQSPNQSTHLAGPLSRTPPRVRNIRKSLSTPAARRCVPIKTSLRPAHDHPRQNPST